MSMQHRSLAILLTLAAAVTAVAQDNRPIAFTNARLVPISGPVIDGGTLVVKNGKIEAIGKDTAVPPGARVIDASGKTILPGLVSAWSRAGLQPAQPRFEEPAGGRRRGGGMPMPQMGGGGGGTQNRAATKVVDGLYAKQTVFGELLRLGVTSLALNPAGGGFPGLGAVLRPDGKTIEQLTGDDSAFVQVGTVTVQFQLINDRWLVRDAALKDDENTVRSALKLATALRQSQEFLNAYSAGDKERLSKVASKSFHDSCLVSADLSQAPVPGKELFEKPYEARQQKDSLDLILKSSTGAVVVSLDVLSKTGTTTPEKSALPLVSEVTLAEDGTRESKRLSSVFLHEAMVNLYSEALVARDVPRLQSMSTLDFRERVWDRIRPDVIKALPLPEIEAAAPEIFHVTYAGAKTEVTVTQGAHALTYVLRSQPGRMEIEDILIPAENRPSSLKLTMENLIPVYEFIAGIEGNNIQRVSHCSADSFNAMIWSQLSEVPDLGFDPIALLTLPLTGMKVDDKLTRLQFGNSKLGAEVQIERSEGQTHIHDMTLITGTGPNNRHELLATMRRMISGGLSSDGKIIQAKAETTSSMPSKTSSLPRIQQSIELQ